MTYSVFFVCFLVFVKSGVIFPDESHNLRRYIIVLIELFDSFGLESGFYSSYIILESLVPLIQVLFYSFDKIYLPHFEFTSLLHGYWT